MPAQEEKLVQRQAKIWIDWLHKVFLVWLSTLGLLWLTCYKIDFSESHNLPIHGMGPSQKYLPAPFYAKKEGAHIICSNFSRFFLQIFSCPTQVKETASQFYQKRPIWLGNLLQEEEQAQIIVRSARGGWGKATLGPGPCVLGAVGVCGPRPRLHRPPVHNNTLKVPHPPVQSTSPYIRHKKTRIPPKKASSLTNTSPMLSYLAEEFSDRKQKRCEKRGEMKWYRMRPQKETLIWTNESLFRKSKKCPSKILATSS